MTAATPRTARAPTSASARSRATSAPPAPGRPKPARIPSGDRRTYSFDEGHPLLSCARPREQALRTPEQDRDHQRVDDEGAELGDVVLAGDIGDAEQQRGEQRAGDRRRSADRDDDQEIDHELERERRIEPEHFGAERAAKPGEAGADGEGEQEDAID